MPALSTDTSSPGWRFDNTYAKLPDIFFASAQPAAASAPQVVILNHNLAQELGLDLTQLSPEVAAKLFSGQELPSGSQAIAQAYAGHQYGHFTILGDGRAILLGEHQTPSGQLVDIQFKGSGQTRFSRRGDGRAALGPMLREYIISEAMAALGIPTTRSLAVVTTGDHVYRSAPLRGAVLTRVASSHIRVGTFEYAARSQDPTHLQSLADYTIARHYPHLMDASQKYLQFLNAVIDRQASLIAKWQLVGFVHGVMNTDNMAISGETIDYGPCAFMNSYKPGTVFSSIDHNGRYAYGNQPPIAQWNLARFAEALLPLLDTDEQQSIGIATEALHKFVPLFDGYWLDGMRKKLGLQTKQDGDLELVRELLDWMHGASVDFTNTFRDLSEGSTSVAACQQKTFEAWQTRWHRRLALENSSLSDAQARMQATNPAIIPRNHRVEEALTAAEMQNDFAPLHQLLAAITSPYQLTPQNPPYRDPPSSDDHYQTFCGT